MADGRKAKRELKRGAIRRDGCLFIGVWVPMSVAQRVDEMIAKEDTDRSKFLREALREKLENGKL